MNGAPQAAGVTATPALRRADASSALFGRPGLHIAIAGLGIFLAALDQTVIVTALWPISTDLQVPVTELDRAAWVITAYLLGYAVALPLMGRVADVYGQRRIYLVSLGIFLLGSFLCAVAPGLGWLIAARGVQAVGGGAVLPVGMAMARQVFKEQRIPVVLGILGAVAEAGGVIGPLWGATILNGLGGTLGVAGWRWIFWINLPLGLLFAALIFFTPRLPHYPSKIDWAGAALLGASLLTLSLALATPGSVGVWAGLNPVDPTKGGGPADLVSPQMVALFFASSLLAIGFLWRERRAADPLLPPRLFGRARRPFAAAVALNFLVGSALIVTMVNVPLYVASVLDGTPQSGGLTLLRMTALIPFGAVVGGLLSSRASYRWVAVSGLLLTALSFALMGTWSEGTSETAFGWLGLAMNGFGFGLLISPVTSTALHWGGLRLAALSAATVTLSRMVGMMVSLSAFTALGLRRFEELMEGHPAVIFANSGETAAAFAKRQAEYTVLYKAAALSVYSTGFFVAGAVCLLAVALALGLRRNPDNLSNVDSLANAS